MIAAACGAALAIPAQAQTWQQIEARYTPQFESCMDALDAAKDLDLGMAACMASETLRQDAMLTQAYSVTLASLQPNAQQELSEAEKAWNRKREDVCREDALGVVEGSKRKLAFSECMLDASVRRAIWLETYRP